MIKQITERHPPTGLQKCVEDVRQFREAADIPSATEPSWPSYAEMDLCEGLIKEEFREVMEAFEARDLVNLGQELTDLVYVVCFAAVSTGIPLGDVWDEVQAANMRKVNPETGKVTRRPDGKILKPEGWYGPDIKKVVFGD